MKKIIIISCLATISILASCSTPECQSDVTCATVDSTVSATDSVTTITESIN